MNYSDLIVSSLFKEKKTDNFVRIIHINENYEDLVIIRFNANGHAPEMPKRIDLENFWEKIESKQLVLQDEDPFLKSEVIISANEEERIDRLKNLFLPLLEQHSKIFYKGSRNKIISDFLTSHPNFKKSIYRKLKEYWVRGCSPNAWISNLAKSGGAGKIRKNGDKKRGRKKLDKKASQGINIGDKERKIIKVGAKKYKHLSIDEAYNQTMAENYGKKKNGEIVINWNICPSKAQFVWWRKKLLSAANLLINEIGEKEYNLTDRPKRGSANKHVFGIGSCYQIDPTKDLVHLVSSVTRTWSIGTPTLYIVRDVYSRMIVGFYITTQPASGIVSRLALENAVTDKVEFCKKYGIDIKHNDWPSLQLPAELFADNADLVSEKANSIIERFGTTVRNARTGRGDDKAIVERAFELLQNRMKGSLKNRGGVGSRFGKRGSKDTRRDSRITLTAYIRMVIYAILEYNRTHNIEGYPFDEGMQRAGISKAIPIDLWNYAKSKGLVCFKKTDHKKLWHALLPVENCIVSDTGIKFMGHKWAPIDPKIDQHIHQNYLTVKEEVKVAYDPRYDNEVYLIHNNSFHKLERTGEPVKYENLFELLAWNNKVKQDRVAHDPVERTAKVNTNAVFDEILDQERKASPSIPVQVNDTQRRRKIEQQIEKASELKARKAQTSKSPEPIKFSNSYRTGRSSSRREISGVKNKLKMKKR